MNRWYASLLTLLASAAAAQTPADGTLLERRTCEPLPPYEEVATLARATRRDPPAEGPYRRLARTTVCERLVYASDGLRVVAILIRPERTGGRPRPVIVYTHGGGADGAVAERVSMEEARWIDEGYLFLAPQYRGVGGSQGRDEYGGADVHDVLNLMPLLRGLGYADTAGIFLWGHSRGGAMALQALSAGMPARAALVTGAVTDYTGRMRGADSAAVWRRSAVAWPERIGVPLLIIHGEADPVVPVELSRRLAARLQALGRPHELVVYPGGDHNLQDHMDDIHRRARAWFRRHRAPD